MTSLRIESVMRPAACGAQADSGPKPQAPSPTPPSASSGWIHINAAAELMGINEGTLRRRCIDDLEPQKLARKIAVGRGGEAWHVHCSIDPSLIRVSAGGTSASAAAEAMTALLRAPEHKRDQAMRKAQAVVRFREWRMSEGVNTNDDFPAFAARLAAELDLRPDPSRRTMYNWDRECPAAGRDESLAPLAAALLDRRGVRVNDATGEVLRGGEGPSDEAWAYFRGLYLTRQKWSIGKCHAVMTVKARECGWTWPKTARHVARLAEREITRQELIMARDGAEAWSKRCLAPMEQAADAWLAGQRWDTDHSRLDQFIRVQSGGRWVARRPWLTAFLDWRSRKLMGWHLSMNPNSDTVRAALHHALAHDEHASLPEIIWLDNGKDFAAAEFTGETKSERRRRGPFKDANDSNAAWCGLFGLLGIAPHFATPYNHNGKARIERFFGTVHMDFDRGSPAWCGSKPGDRDADTLADTVKDVMSLPTLDELREKFDRWSEWYNARSEHSIDDLRDQNTGERLAPSVFYARSIAVRRVFDRAVLPLLEQKWSRPMAVSKRGIALTIGGRAVRYGAGMPELAAFVASERRVYVTYDPRSTRQIRVYDDAFRFVCVAPENETYGGMAMDAVSVEARKRAWRAQRQAKRDVQRRIDETALILSDAELAAVKQREIDVEQTQADLRAAGVGGTEPPPMRMVGSPLSGQAQRVEREELRRAAGAEGMSGPIERGPSMADILAAERAQRAEDDDGDDDLGDSIPAFLTPRLSLAEPEDEESLDITQDEVREALLRI